MRSLLMLCVAATAAAAEDSSFEAADKYLREESNARACDGFTAYLKANPGSALEREARAKRARACMKVGRAGSWFNELQQTANAGEKDWARAYACTVVAEAGYVDFATCLPLLKQAIGDGRVGDEARALFIRGAFRDLDNYTYDRKRTLERVSQLLEVATKPNEKARARLYRARLNLRDTKTFSEGEKELRELGEGGSDVADDALYELAQAYENQTKFVPALELYDAVVKRFSPQTSNVREYSQNKAAEIRRPSASISVSYIEIPGSKPQVSFSYRNVVNASWKVRRVDPLALDANAAVNQEEDAFQRAASETTSTWTSKLTVPSKHAWGSSTFEVDLKNAGAYLLEVDADGQKDKEVVLITSHATVMKIEQESAVTFTADALSGAAVPNADVVLYLQSQNGSTYDKLTAKADATGLARFDLKGKKPYQAVSWTKAAGSYSFARGYVSGWSEPTREHLGYILMDRPLYKPGETVGLKVFLRSRQDGPSVPLANEKFTLYVRDPQGRELAKPELTTNAFGTAHFTLLLKADAQLGQYWAQLQVSSSSVNQAQAGFRVEEYKPPEYTVSVAPIGKPEPGAKLKFKVSASFFFGGPVANAQGRALVQVRYWQHQFGPWGDEPVDDDPYGGSGGGGYKRYGRGYDDEIGYGYGGQVAQHTLTFKTGADGTAEVEVPALKAEQIAGWPGVEYAVQVFVTDASRREVTGSGSIKTSTSPFFADLRADRFIYKPGEKIDVTLRAEDANGKPEDPELHVRLVRVTPQGASTPIAKGKSKLSGGRGTVKLDADALGPVRIEVRASDANDAPLLASSDVWLTNDAKPMMPEGYGFQLFTDRAPLKVGNMVRALVVAPTAGGHVLVSIENERLQWVKALELSGRAKFVEIPLSADMAPNSWLHVFRFEQASPMQTSVEVRVKGSEVELPVKVAFAKTTTEPGTTVPVTIEAPGAPKGSESEVAVTVVDEALYAIEAARTDFLSFFGRRRRELRVQTSSTMNQKSYRRPVPKQEPTEQPKPIVAANEVARDDARLAGASGRAMPEAAAPAKSMAGMGESAKKDMAPAEEKASAKRKEARGPGAGADLDDREADRQQVGQAPVKVRTDFGSSSGWFAALAGKAGAPLRQDVKLKDSLTTWRATAYVVTNGPNLGVGQGSVRTEKPLMVRLQAPRFFTERDEVTLSAIVVSRLTKAVDVDVSISAPGLKALGPAQKLVKVGPGEDVRFDVRFQVIDIGERTVKAVARSGALADAMEWKLPSMIHGSAQRKSYAGRLSDKFTLELDLPEKRNPKATRFELTLSPSLLSVMFDALPYLAQYPYGCVEQTLSRFVPAAIARRAVKDLSLPATRVPAELDDMVDAGLKRLYGFQHSDGGWGWWQSDNTNKWMSAYVVYGLGLGREAGLNIDASVLERGRSYLNGVLGAARNEPETQAFMTYALASTGGAPKSALDFAFGARTKLSPRGRALVALALLAAKDSRARIAVENLDDVVKAASARADAAVGEANDAWSTSAAIEATAYTLMAMVRYDLNSPNIKPLTDFLVLRRNGGKWRSTRDTAFAVYALSDLARREEASGKSGGFVVLVNGREVKRLSFTKGGIDLTAPIVLEDSAFKAGKNVIEVRRDGGGSVTGYFAGIFDVFNQNDFIKGVGGDVVVTRKYTLLGKPSTEPGSAPTEYGMPLESGTRVRVDLEVKANKAVEFVMIEDLKPAGLEAVMLKSGPEVCNFQCAHAELRTDRVAMFLQAIPVGVTKLSYELRAEVPGKFSALPARAEAMYAPEIQATSDEMRFEVRDAPDSNLVGR